MSTSVQPAPLAAPASVSASHLEAKNDPHWRASEWLLVREVVRLMGGPLPPERVLREMLHLMSELLGLNRGRIVLADAPCPGVAATSRICYAYGLTQAEIAGGVYASGEGVTGRVLASGRAMLVQDINAETPFLGRTLAHSPQPVAFLALPIQARHQTVGVLGCLRERHLRPLSDDMALLQVLATLAGQVLARQAPTPPMARNVTPRRAQPAPADGAATRDIVGSAPRLLRALDDLERVAQADASVLLWGESGTGKALFAQALHRASPRRDAPFVRVNCPAMPDNGFASELFKADQGTLFLDEVGELPLALQARLLCVLQEGRVLQPAGPDEARVDVRVVATTQHDLAAAVAHGAFRRDLYHRLNVVAIPLPALRERREDIRSLALTFLDRANQAHRRSVRLSAGALQRLQSHDWPGNVRELGHAMERLVLLTHSTLVPAAEMARFLPQSSRTEAPPPIDTPPLVREYTQAHAHSPDTLRAALDLHQGNQSRAAQALGLTVRQFSYRLQKAGLR